MSLSVSKKSGVKLKSSKQRGGIILTTLIIIESIFTFFLYLSLAGKIFAPPPAQSALGVPEQISYQGRLTDTSGNPLGGAGTPYCFRYSIYNDPSTGSKLWPSGTPATSTITVADGVFSDQIGRTGLDSLTTLDFMSTSTLYLNVEVNTATSTCTGTWSSLLPRQQITSAGFAQTAQNIYGDRIRTNVANKVQIGTGAGQATSSITLLSLDVANVMESVGSSCSNNGTLWYNSSSTRAYVCEAGLIQAISNSSTTIAGIGVNASTPVTAGNVVFSNSNNITFGLNGSTITASAAGGGGGIGAIAASNTTYTSGTVIISGGANVTVGTNGQTITISAAAGGGGGGFAIKDFALFDRAYMLAITNMTATGITQRPIFVPFVLPGSLTWNRGDIEVSRATSGSNLFTADFGIYSYVNSTQISLMGSLRNTYSGTNTGSQSGIRRILFTGMDAGATALTPGAYIMGMKFSAANTASMNYSLRGATLGPPVGNIFPGANSYVTATSQLSSMPLARFLGIYTTTSANLPNSIGFNQVQHWTSMYRVYFHLEST